MHWQTDCVLGAMCLPARVALYLSPHLRLFVPRPRFSTPSRCQRGDTRKQHRSSCSRRCQKRYACMHAVVRFRYIPTYIHTRDLLTHSHAHTCIHIHTCVCLCVCVCDVSSCVSCAHCACSRVKGTRESARHNSTRMCAVHSLAPRTLAELSWLGWSLCAQHQNFVPKANSLLATGASVPAVAGKGGWSECENLVNSLWLWG
jgi:hypothetical protein